MPEMDLKGHVDICSKTVIRGWSLATSDLTQRVEVEFVQGDCVIGSVTPSIPAPKLLEVLKVGERQDFARPFVWQLPYPLALGIKPDTPFSVRFRANSRELGGGSGRIIRTVETIDPEAKDDLEHQTFINAHYSMADQSITGHVVVMGRDVKPQLNKPFSILKNGQATDIQALHVQSPMQYIDAPAIRLDIRFEQADCDDSGQIHAQVLKAENATDRVSRHEELRSLFIPASAFDHSKLRYPLPAESNMERITGPGAATLGHLIQGYTTFKQIDRISEMYYGKGIKQFETVVDWGSGCGRILRHFSEHPNGGRFAETRNQDLFGFDIDAVNVEWCEQNMPDVATFDLIEPLGTFSLPDDSVDLLYGISVMTHLTEHAQCQWLKEIRRVLKPGGGAILTTHGEHFFYAGPGFNDPNRMLSVPFLEKYGFLDIYRDANLGGEHMEHYRATYQSRKHVRDTWRRYLDILDVIPATNAWRQDFVVLKKT
jgi:SAM-dependent methyltransferase